MLSAAVLTAVIVLAGDPVSFDAAYKPQFTDKQLRTSNVATRDGLARWSATAEGHKLLDYFAENRIAIDVVEDGDEPGIGRAPDPRLQVLVAAANHKRVRNFEIVLNPRYFSIPKGWTPLPNEPATASDAMAAAWAGEMLHIYFYARGIGLPHHSRGDFQDEWREAATELGMPALEHDDDPYVRHVTRVR